MEAPARQVPQGSAGVPEEAQQEEEGGGVLLENEEAVRLIRQEQRRENAALVCPYGVPSDERPGGDRLGGRERAESGGLVIRHSSRV